MATIPVELGSREIAGLASGSAEMVFPLPVLPFEHYLLADDRPDYPMTAFARLGFGGRIDPERLDRAVETALAWHPLLKACVRGGAEDRTAALEWVAAAAPPEVAWQKPSTRPQFIRSVAIDLHREPGLRLWALPAGSKTELVAQIHHACCDGLGALQFFEKLLSCYATGDNAPPPAEWSGLHALRDRISQHRRGETWRDWGKMIGRDLGRIRRFFCKRPAPLAALRDAPLPIDLSSFLPAFISHEFTEAETAQIQAAADRLSATMNTLLLRDQFLTLDEWNRMHSRDGRSRPLRIAVPFNLRRTRASATPAFNAVSIKFMNRAPATLADAHELLQGLHHELEEFKTLRRGTTLLPALRFLGRFRRGITSQVGTHRCLASAVFSNVGQLFAGSPLLGEDEHLRADDLVLETFESAPPVRPNTRTSFAVFTYGRRLIVNLCCDVYYFTAAEANDLLQQYVARVRASVGLP